jgi:ketosteroid isomerase-like protein
VAQIVESLEAARRKPKPDFDVINAAYHPGHEFVSLLQRVEGGVAKGARGYRDWLAENDESWAWWDIKATEVRSIDGDCILVGFAFSGLSKLGRVPVEETSAGIVTIRDGQIVRTEIYSSAEKALEAAGLSE